ncbi:MAG: hypothetical protein GX254_11485, partial [Clostridiales bacterium]|nr:hypothetical protein [Clostridiales bacterium]
MVRLLKYEFYKLLHNRLLLIAIPALVIIFVLITRYKAPVADIYTRLIIILSNPVPAMWFVVVLAPFFVCDGYRSRTFNAAIYQGIGRVKTAVSRILVFYIYIAVITFLSVFAG